ncbi:Integrase catalytic domain-containing protein, partial [Aphis craccivora]
MSIGAFIFINKEEKNHFDLFLINNLKTSHYCYIKDFSRLIRDQKTKNCSKLIMCKRCFTTFGNKTCKSKLWGETGLTEHKKMKTDNVYCYIADNDCEALPDVKAALYNQTYMDDICIGTDSLEAAKILQSDLIKVFARSGLQLKKWASNNSELLAHLPTEDCSRAPLTFDQDDASPVLGMRWNHGKDYFSFSPNNFKMILTKRGVLSMIARIFDPIGMLAPSIFYAKSIMQRVWLAHIGWDDQLPSDLAEEWTDFYPSLGWLTGIKIPRYIGCSDGCRFELCGFCDASVKGYAAVEYFRVTDPSGGTRVYLIGSKTKLAPIKTVTIPRLELCGAVLLALWLCRLKRILENNFL